MNSLSTRSGVFDSYNPCYHFFMSSNDTKKKRESILESLARLNDQLNIAQIDGNKRKTDSIKRTMERLEKDLKALKSYS